jgi:tyrosyl-tRNA synthetase
MRSCCTKFVELGHRVILLIGDFTARIGDPTGRSDSRPRLSDEQIAANMHDYRVQAGTVLDLERTEIMYNSTWLQKLTMVDLIGLLSHTTVAQMLARNDFSERYASGTPIALHEFLYPIVQAYDSIAMQADVELGGSDQLFNLLVGRDYQERYGQPRQICMTTPILEGTDGVVRMGKDAMLPRYAALVMFRPAAEVAALEAGLASGSIHPMTAKKDLAEDIVRRYHGAEAARAARAGFEATVQRGELPTEMPEVPGGTWRNVLEALVGVGLAKSKRDAERLVAGGGVRLDGVPIVDAHLPWSASDPVVLAVGSRRFVRVLPRPSPTEGPSPTS